MEKQNYDVIVLGVGGMGSSACASLARDGIRVLGIESFSRAHDLGSSHGQLRLIRQAYFEHPDYVPLLKKAYSYWQDLEENTDGPQLLFVPSGLLIMTPKEDSTILKGVKAASKQYGIPISEWGQNEIRKNYPQFQLEKDSWGIFEPSAGYLKIEKCILAYCGLAEKFGASLHFNESVLKWESNGKTVTVHSDKGIYEASRLVITAGPWTSQVLSGLHLPLEVRRVPQFWFKGTEGFSSQNLPCFAFDLPEGFFYGFPQIENLIKIAGHRPLEKVLDPVHVSREIKLEDSREVMACVSKHLPQLRAVPEKASVCMYTMTPDENFIVDIHPEYPNVVLAGGFSGHGYKFASVVGPILKDLALRGSTGEPIGFLRLRWK